MKVTNNLRYADNLRVLSTVSVILLHISAMVLHRGVSVIDWWVANIYDGLVRFCVPVFVMLSGALMLSKDYELGAFLKKRLLRVILPFLFWSCIYVCHDLFLDYMHHGSKYDIPGVFYTMYIKLRDGACYHLWYVYMIIGLYLFIPVIGKFIRHCSNIELFYFLGIWFLTLLLHFPKIGSYFPNLNLGYFSGYLGYLILGHVLANVIEINSRKTMIIAIVFTLAGLVITIFGNAMMHYKGGEEVFFDYLTPNVAIFSAGVFMLVKSMREATVNKRIAFVRDLIGKYSYGIYLIHLLTLGVILKLGISGHFIHPILGIPLTTLLCTGLSLTIIAVLSKIPYIKQVAG